MSSYPNIANKWYQRFEISEYFLDRVTKLTNVAKQERFLSFFPHTSGGFL